MDDMSNVGLWGRLSLEIEEQMLALLPMRTLCKSRAVCKRWNSIIGSPKFGALWIRNARQGACGVVARRYTIEGDGHGWVFLDLDATRWYTLQKYDDLKDAFEHGCSVTMDGGLVCHTLFTSAKDDNEAVSAIVNLDVDRCSCAHNHRILVMPNGDLMFDGKPISADIPLMIVYVLETDQWRSSSIPLTLLHSWNLMPDQPSVPIQHKGPLLCLRKPFVGFRVWGKNPVKHNPVSCRSVH